MGVAMWREGVSLSRVPKGGPIVPQRRVVDKLESLVMSGHWLCSSGDRLNPGVPLSRGVWYSGCESSVKELSQSGARIGIVG